MARAPRRLDVRKTASGAALVAAMLAAAGAALAQGTLPAWPRARGTVEGSVVPNQTAVLQGLDKITARVFRIEAPVGQVVRFGTLEIVAMSCQETPPEEPPESAAYLDITEIKPGEPPTELFQGWMFASSPAVSALEHPVYDVWVVDCKNPSKAPGGSSG